MEQQAYTHAPLVEDRERIVDEVGGAMVTLGSRLGSLRPT
jgi:hypothetical protein